ncbi:glycosyltransferase family 8 protein [Cohnella hongkongensis]|uniref:Glycosyltransferase family 8 protein n=1 Tax=Cohnella hongkongensis TaxID=178337 RepID=A0ABV9F666_9BACL
MPNKPIIHIVAATDDSYVQHLGVAMKSLLIHLSHAWARFYVLHNPLSASNREKLVRTLDGERAELLFLPVESGAFSGLPTNHHINETSYAKIVIPELLKPYDLDKAIYIDCDVVVRGDLLPLWNLDLQGRSLAAVRDIGGDFRKAELGIPASSGYFNAGVLVFDMRRWTEKRLTGRVMSMMERHPDKLVFHDQDALNAVLHDDWLELPVCWNFQTNRLQGPEPANLCVIHYTGASKPWHSGCQHPYGGEYFKYLAQTSWASFRPKRNWRRMLRNAVKSALPPPLLRWLSRRKGAALH